jgi:hypothetical protein
MEKLNHSWVRLYFKFGAVHNSYMTVTVNGVTVVPDHNEQAQVETLVEFPGELILELSGKNNNTDTLVNDAGEIVQDKFVQLTQVQVDRMTVNNHFLQKWPVVNDSFVTAYFGFNGQAKLTFDAPSSFHWFLKIK